MKKNIPTPIFIARALWLQPWLFCLALLFNIGSWLLVLAPGLLTQAFFSVLTKKATAGFTIWTIVILLLMAEIARVAVTFATYLIEITFRLGTGSLLRTNLLEAILRRPEASSLLASPGEAVARFRDDIDQITFFLGASLLEFVSMIVMTTSAFVIMLRVNVTITVTVFVPLIGVVIVAHIAQARITRYRSASSQATANATGMLGEVFGAVQMLKVATAEKRLLRHLSQLHAQRQQADLKESLFNGMLGAVFSSTVNLGTGIILLVAAQAMRAGTFTIADFALFVYNLGSVTNIISFVGTMLARYQQIGVAFTRLEALLQRTPLPQLLKRQTPDTPELFPVDPSSNHSCATQLQNLTVDGLSYQYPGTEQGIHNIHLRVERGQCVVITGRVGSGKTTLLRVLLGLLPKDTGDVCWNGQSVNDLTAFFVPPHSAYTAQVPHLFSDSLKENVLLGLPESERNLTEALHLAVMERDIQQLEQGLETRIGSRGVKLSGGQAQRTAAARMFLRHPELLVFDDLSSALDVETEQKLWQRLFVSKNVTCIVASHRRALLRHANHIIVLKKGKIEAQGRLDQLLAECEEMRYLWHNDLEGDEREGSLL